MGRRRERRGRLRLLAWNRGSRRAVTGQMIHRRGDRLVQAGRRRQRTRMAADRRRLRESRQNPMAGAWRRRRAPVARDERTSRDGRAGELPGRAAFHEFI
jgi:hypothetical protein